MNPPKWIILITAVSIFCLPVHGTGKEIDDLEDTKEVKHEKSEKVLECDKGKCKGSECECCPGYDVNESGLFVKSYSCEILECDKGKCKENECECCPGYGVKESGLWIKSYSCEKCNCGEDFGCSFSWLGKTCVCPTGYSYFKGVCRERLFLQWFNALANFVVLTSEIAFSVVEWMFTLLYFVAYFIIFIALTLVKWIFLLLYFLCVCIYIIAVTAVKWFYSLIYNGAMVFVICWLTLPIILEIDYKDYFLLWYMMGTLFLNKLQERRKVHLTSTVKNPNDNYNIICGLLKKIFELHIDDPPKNTDEIALKDFLYQCPICLGSQIEILLDKGSFYTMKCGHIYCNSCIENMEGATTVTCAVCKETCQRENFRKIFLL